MLFFLTQLFLALGDINAGEWIEGKEYALIMADPNFSMKNRVPFSIDDNVKAISK